MTSARIPRYSVLAFATVLVTGSVYLAKGQSAPQNSRTEDHQASSAATIDAAQRATAIYFGPLRSRKTVESFFGASADQLPGCPPNAGGIHYYNTCYGYSAGQLNTLGKYNSFFGHLAGKHNRDGLSNSFFGSQAGLSNVTGSNNALFGVNSGHSNVAGNNNSFFGASAGFNNTGSNNSFFGNEVGFNNRTGEDNSFFGAGAGASNDSGGFNSFFGRETGRSNTIGVANSFFGGHAGWSNVSGSHNSFFGVNAGRFNETGSSNSFFGLNAGLSNKGSFNSFFGVEAGSITTANYNSFFGNEAGRSNGTGTNNSFFGAGTGYSNNTGSNNSFFGVNAGKSNKGGSGNSFFGFKAGYSNTTGSDNIYIAHQGVGTENRTIRIGSNQTQTFIAGISGATISGGISVVVNTNGQLGIQSSSRQFKKDIRDMGDVSSRLMLLRPVTFYYKPEFSPGPRTLQYGLIAEEVAEVYPELVQHTAMGQPYAVRYQLAIPMLLNEMQKQYEKIKSHEQQIAEQARQIADLTSRLERLGKEAQTNKTRKKQ